MTTERSVRFTAAFFDRLDMLLPVDRSAEGDLSATDFLLFDLPPISDKLARSFENETFTSEAFSRDDLSEFEFAGRRHRCR